MNKADEPRDINIEAAWAHLAKAAYAAENIGSQSALAYAAIAMAHIAIALVERLDNMTAIAQAARLIETFEDRP